MRAEAVHTLQDGEKLQVISMLKQYTLWNWALILVLRAFIISLRETVFLDKTTIRRFHFLIAEVFLLSIVVSAEFYLADHGSRADIRSVLMAVRYSATPLIAAQVIYTLVKKLRWTVFLPAILLAVINFSSVFNGLVFHIGSDNTFYRGPLGSLPYIGAGFYCIVLIRTLIRRSNRQIEEIIPIAFIGFAFGSGLLLPFLYGRDYSQIFCTTIGISLYVYYVFQILQLTKIDPLTGLLNRQAFYAETEHNAESITALISIDMNGLKEINDSYGHLAGDEALSALAHCFLRARGRKQFCYRLGGDEFVIVCHDTSESELQKLVADIRRYVTETGCSCSIGFSHISEGVSSVEKLLQRSDEKMYEEKVRYYQSTGRRGKA